MWRHVAANGLWLLVIAIAGVAVAVQVGKATFREAGPLRQAAFFEVESGETLRSVADRLAESGIVESAPVFRIGAEYSGLAGELRFGTYEIPAGASMEAVLSIVTSGGPSVFPYTATYVLRVSGEGEMRLRERRPGSTEVVEIATFRFGDEGGVPEAYADLAASGAPITWRVLVPEGLTSWAIATALSAADFLQGGVAEVPQDGTLAPDTYEVERGSAVADLIDRMQARQSDIVAEVWAARPADAPVDSPEEMLTLASIIEKETGVSSERDLIAGVFANRLAEGWRLETDPTVIYAASEGRGYLGRGIRQSELDADHPYNTYRVSGLPPGPIANPGRAAIEAALSPEDTDFMFFAADGTGGHAFATTYEDHLVNVARLRRLEAEREAESDG